MGREAAVASYIDAKRHAYDPDEIARVGAFIVVGHNGVVRIERGFMRAEDEAPEPEAETIEDGETVIDGVRVSGDGEILDSDGEDGEGDDRPEAEPEREEEAGDAGKPLPGSLIRDLTAHRTLGLHLAPGEQPDMSLIAVIHTLAAQTFYRGGSTAHRLEITPPAITSPPTLTASRTRRRRRCCMTATPDGRWTCSAMWQWPTSGASSPVSTMRALWHCSRIVPR